VVPRRQEHVVPQAIRGHVNRGDVRHAPLPDANVQRARARGQGAIFFKRGWDLVDVSVGYGGTEFLGCLQDGGPV